MDNALAIEGKVAEVHYSRANFTKPYVLTMANEKKRSEICGPLLLFHNISWAQLLIPLWVFRRDSVCGCVAPEKNLGRQQTPCRSWPLHGFWPPDQD